MDGLDPHADEPEDHEPEDQAAAAFEALRVEVASLRRAIEARLFY